MLDKLRSLFKNAKNGHFIVQIQLDSTLTPGDSQKCFPGYKLVF